MKIGELAGKLGINTRTVRYYERIGLLPEPQRTSSGYREYGDTDLERLTFIKTAQRIGMSLNEIREILALRLRGEPPCGYVRDVLHHQVTQIDIRIAELQQLRQHLVKLDELADKLPPSTHGCRIIDHVGHVVPANHQPHPIHQP